MPTTVATYPSSSELSDPDSSSSMEILLNPIKLKEKLAQALEEEKKAAAKKGDPIRNDGKVRSGRIERLERIIKARKTMRAQVIQKLNEHFQKSHARRDYDNFRRDLPPELDLCLVRSERSPEHY